MDWEAIAVAAGIATGISTTLTVLLSSLWRVIDRQRVRWSPTDVQFTEKDPSGRMNLEMELVNVGDGTAMRVIVAGLACSATLAADDRLVEWVVAVRPGDRVKVRLWCEYPQWDVAQIAVIWTSPPTWPRGRRVHYLPIRDVLAQPIDEDPEPIDVVEYGDLVAAQVAKPESLIRDPQRRRPVPLERPRGPVPTIRQPVRRYRMHRRLRKL